MRKFITLLASTLLILSLSLQAQIKRGSVLLGGDFSFYSQVSENTTNKYTANNFYFAPSFGKAVKENTIWGGQMYLGFGKNYSGIISAGDSKQNLYGAGVFHRKYKTIGGNFYLFLQGDLNAQFGKIEYNTPDLNYDQKSIYINTSLYPGISYLLSKKLVLEAGFRDIVEIGYIKEKREGYNFGSVINTSSNSFSLTSSLNNFNSALSVGFRLFLNNETKKQGK